MSACEATTLDRIVQGRDGSPVSARTAAAVSSQDVSMARSGPAHRATAAVSNARFSDSANGGLKMPRSVMMPVM